jgi:hypothetical protein
MLMFTSSDRIVTSHLSQVTRLPGLMFSFNAALTVVVVSGFFLPVLVKLLVARKISNLFWNPNFYCNLILSQFNIVHKFLP